MTKNKHINLGALYGFCTVLVLTAYSSGTAPQPQSTATNTTAAQLDIPKSEFDDSLPNARDPFFPKFQAGPTPVSTNMIRTASSLLVVKGMSVRGTSRLVVIGSAIDIGKSWSLEPGDEREIILGNSRVKLRCDEIRDDVVVVSLGTPPQRIELPIPKTY
jgi:hypothetical protein